MRLNVAYASSEKYAKYAYISLLSLFENNKDIDEIYVYYIEENLSDTSKNLLSKMVKSYDRKVEFIPLIDIWPSEIDINAILPIRGSVITYIRIFLTKLKGVDRILSLDSDVIINGSLRSLWELDLQDNYYSGVMMTIPKNHKSYDGTHDWYMNGGVVIQQLDKLREDNSHQKFVNFLRKYKNDATEEAAYYNIYIDKILPMMPEYNVESFSYLLTYQQREKLVNRRNYYSQECVDNAINKPVIIHYVHSFFGQPWEKKCSHPQKDIFLHYLNMSPWADELEEADICIRNKITRFVFMHIPFKLFLLLKLLYDKLKR